MSKPIIIDIDETLLNGLNNALAAYGDLVFSLIIGCEVSDKFEGLKNLSEEELRQRFNKVKELYLKIETELKI